MLKIQHSGPLDTWLTANDNPYAAPYANIAYQYNKAREMVIHGGYDALLTVESDMIVPPDALQRLLACKSDVAYGLYVFRHTRHNWSAYTKVLMDTGRSLSEDAEAARAAWGTVQDVEGVGLGCTLIRREVLTTIAFRQHPDTPDKTACDWLFALDCKVHRYDQRCDLGVVCGHISYKPYPMIVWPDLDMPRLYRRETLEGVAMKPIGAGDQFHVGMGEVIVQAQA